MNEIDQKPGVYELTEAMRYLEVAEAQLNSAISSLLEAKAFAMDGRAKTGDVGFDYVLRIVRRMINETNDARAYPSNHASAFNLLTLDLANGIVITNVPTDDQ